MWKVLRKEGDVNPSADDAAMSAESIEDAAAAWFCKRDSGNWSAEDQAGFAAWLSQSTAHRVAWLRLQAAWKGAARMQALGAGIPRGEVPPPGHWGNDRFLGGKSPSEQKPTAQPSPLLENDVQAPKVRRFKALRSGLAATVILALGVTLYIQAVHGPWAASRYATPVGGRETVSLADGSRVTLNTDTQIRVDFSGKERRVDLSKGEAFFAVAKDPARPFIVYVDDKRVTAVGTEFSVRRVADDIQVVVTEGRVKLEQGSARAQVRKLVGLADRPATLLVAGAVARTARSDVLVQDGSAPEVEQLLSWRSGYLVFEAMTLADAVAEFNRYNTRKIVIDDPSLAALRIGGNFRASNTDAFLWLLQSAFRVQIEEHDGRVHLSSH